MRKMSKIDLPLSQRVFNFGPRAATLTKHFVNPGNVCVCRLHPDTATRSQPVASVQTPLAVTLYSQELMQSTIVCQYISAYISYERDNSHWATVIIIERHAIVVKMIIT